MVDDARYVKDTAGWDALATGRELTAIVVGVLEKAQAYAEGISPRSTQDERAYFDRRFGASSDTTRYVESFHTRTYVHTYRTGPRVVGVLENSSPHAVAVEVGNRENRKPHHVLGRTAAAIEHL